MTASNKQSAYRSEAELAHAVSQELFGRSHSWARLCHCQKQRFLQRMAERRSEGVVMVSA